MRRAAILGIALALGGCERAVQGMYDQPRYHRMQGAPDEPQGSAVRPLPQASIARSGREEREAEHAQGLPHRVDAALLEHGRDRYTIYCEPCHSPVGDGDGIIPERGFPHPPSYHIDRLRNAPDRHFYDVISNGYGIMYSYADRVTPGERWAIVAYIRALQLSQYAPAEDLK